MRRSTRRFLGNIFITLFSLPILAELAKGSKKSNKIPLNKENNSIQGVKQPTAVEWQYIELSKFLNGKSEFTHANDILLKAKEMDEQKMINALIEFSKANFDIHTGAAIRYITNKAEQYYNEQFKQQEQ